MINILAVLIDKKNKGISIGLIPRKRIFLAIRYELFVNRVFSFVSCHFVVYGFMSCQEAKNGCFCCCCKSDWALAYIKCL